jgi:Carboxypeptidase regulatory-like domain
MKLLWIFLLLAGVAGQPQAIAQSLAQAVRVVQGMAQNAEAQPQQNAVVYLQDQKTLEVRTYITEADGHYRFGQLSSDVDYQLWAEYKGRKSKTRSISSFDSKKQFNFDLKIDTPK